MKKSIAWITNQTSKVSNDYNEEGSAKEPPNVTCGCRAEVRLRVIKDLICHRNG